MKFEIAHIFICHTSSLVEVAVREKCIFFSEGNAEEYAKKGGHLWITSKGFLFQGKYWDDDEFWAPDKKEKMPRLLQATDVTIRKLKEGKIESDMFNDDNWEPYEITPETLYVELNVPFQKDAVLALEPRFMGLQRYSRVRKNSD